MTLVKLCWFKALLLIVWFFDLRWQEVWCFEEFSWNFDVKKLWGSVVKILIGYGKNMKHWVILIKTPILWFAIELKEIRRAIWSLILQFIAVKFLYICQRLLRFGAAVF